MSAGVTLLERAIEGVKRLALPACLKDSALRYHYVNDAYARLMRRPAEEMLGWGTYQLTGIIDDVEREDKERHALVFASEQAIGCHIDGAAHRRKLHCERFVTEDDAIFLYEVFEQAPAASNDPDWERREQMLLEAKAERDALIAEQESLLQSLPFGVLLLSRECNILYVNEAFYDLWEVDKKFDLKGKSYRDYLEHNYYHGLSDYGSMSFEELYEDRIQFFDSENLTDKREVKTRYGNDLLITKSKLANDKVLLTLSNVTEVRQRESELASLLARAEAADHAKSEFLANMSHEIRTPMNGVLGMAELLSRSGLNARQKTFTDVIVKSANALLTIINDILDFSKLDAGELSLRQAPFQPSDAVEDVASLLCAEALDKGVELIVDIKPDAFATVMGDAGRFRQIVINLIGNAVKFTEYGHILVSLTLETSHLDQPQLRLDVSDSGIGIAPSDLQRIFDKFNQAGSTNIRRHEGTGLGLSITAGLVHLFGGTISAKSDVNVGSHFTVQLPVSVEHKDSPIMVRRFDSTRPSVLTIGGSDIGHRILLGQLTNWGIDAHHAVDGDMGLAILREAESIGFQIDAVIIDHRIDAVDDIRLAQRIRQDNDFHNIGIIAIDAISRHVGQTMGADHDVDLVIARPVRGMILRRALSELILEKRRTLAPSLPQQSLSPAHVARPDILVAEDNDVNQIVFSQILQQNGLSFRIVSNGQQALEAWQRQRPSLIVMDISMPQMDGLEATKFIRKEELAEGLAAHVPIIGVSAHRMENERKLCLNAGMDDYISKPVSPDVLINKISQWLEHQLSEAETNGH